MAWPRLGFAAWFGAGLWFGAFGAPALFSRLGTAGAAAPLAALFPSIFAFGLGAGGAALLGALATLRRRRGVLRLVLALVVTLAAVVELAVILPHLQSAPPGSAAFARGHVASVTIAFIGWLGSGIALIVEP
jgi:hypothetical protein